jgi:hypothetical protein
MRFRYFRYLWRYARWQKLPFSVYNPGMWFFKKWRRKRISNQPFPPEWLAIIEGRVPFYRKLTVLDKEELKQHILVFLAEKHFFGCGGLTITDEIKVTIAAQACVLLLHRETDYYPGLSSILVYPAAYVAKETRHLAGGIVEEGFDVRLGSHGVTGRLYLAGTIYGEARRTFMTGTMSSFTNSRISWTVPKVRATARRYCRSGQRLSPGRGCCIKTLSSCGRICRITGLRCWVRTQDRTRRSFSRSRRNISSNGQRTCRRHIRIYIRS